VETGDFSVFRKKKAVLLPHFDIGKKERVVIFVPASWTPLYRTVHYCPKQYHGPWRARMDLIHLPYRSSEPRADISG
jgi:hypothetical protein